MRNNYVGLILGVSLFTCLLGVNSAQSAVVSNCDETSLRAAIAQGGKVSFACDGVVHLNSTLDITQDVAIDGTGRDVSISGSNLVRIFKVQTNTSLELVSLTLTEGRIASTNLTAGEGGALLNLGGTVKARSCVFIGNSAIGHSADFQNLVPNDFGTPGRGGAICNWGGSVHLSRCTFKNNLAQGGGANTYRGGAILPGASGSGGAIFNAGVLTTRETTFVGNKTRGADPVFVSGGDVGGMAPGFGGAVANSGAFAGTNLTFAANLAEGGSYQGFITVRSFGQGGAIQNDGTGICVNCTIASNVAIPVSLSLSASQIASTNGSFTLMNSIVAGAPGTNTCLGIIADGGHNIGSDGSANFTAPTSRNNLNPLLGPLANNGGPTLTMALLPGSPAIDAGSSANFPPTDQRGVTRPQGLASDIGAFESNYATTVALTENAVRAAVETGGSFAFNLSGQLSLSAPLVVSKNTTLDGSGQIVVLSGNNAHRVFEILPGASLTLVNLTIRDGLSTNGGGILNHGNLSLIGCILSTNTAAGVNGIDGIAGTNGGPAVPQSVAPNNGGPAEPGGLGMDALGGAILNVGSLFATNTQFLGNTAQGGAGGMGGAGGRGQVVVSSRGFPAGGGNGGAAGNGGSGGAARGSVLYNLGTATLVNCFAQGNVSTGGPGGAGGVGGVAPHLGMHGAAGGGGTGGKAIGTIWNSDAATIHFTTLAFNRAEGGQGGEGGAGADGSPPGLGGPGGAGADAMGGGVWSEGTCTLLNSTMAHNHAQGGNGGYGGKLGGVFCRAKAGDGGSGFGGALFDVGSLSLASSTVWNNSTHGGTSTNPPPVPGCELLPNIPGIAGAGFGASIVASNSTDLKNTIIGGHSSTSNCVGVITDSRHNICSDNSAHFTDLTSRNSLDPLLGPLASNGGPTLTLSPLPGSPAIDSGDDSSAPDADQRGVRRPQGAHTDIGAVEATFLRIEKLANGSVRLRYAGIPGESYTLEGKPAFSDLWSGIETKPAGAGGSLQYSDLPGSASQRLFRVKSP